jgi:hypothetical protein
LRHLRRVITEVPRTVPAIASHGTAPSLVAHQLQVELEDVTDRRRVTGTAGTGPGFKFVMVLVPGHPAAAPARQVKVTDESRYDNHDDRRGIITAARTTERRPGLRRPRASDWQAPGPEVRHGTDAAVAERACKS